VEDEIQILTQLCRRGFDVVCIDLSGKANFDFLAPRSGAELEAECKTTAPDAGQKIHLDELTCLGGHLHPISQRLFETGGALSQVICSPRRLSVTSAIQTSPMVRR
jgi:hypothetical protein